MADSTQVKFRGGTTAENAAMVPADREMVIDTDKNIMAVGDGTQAGGHEMLAANLSNYDLTRLATILNLSTLDTSGAASVGGLLTALAGLAVTGTVTPTGGIYLGGTGSANLMDDYEEGTFTPTYTAGSGAYTVMTTISSGNYTKVGSMVFAPFNVYTTAITVGAATGRVYMSSLPFAAAAGGGSGTVGVMQNFNLSVAKQQLGVVVDAGESRAYFTKMDSNASVGYVETSELKTGGGGFDNLVSGLVAYPS